MKGETQDLDKEVDGVAGEVSLGPAPVGLLDDETGIGGEFKITRLLCDELEFALFQERRCTALSLHSRHNLVLNNDITSAQLRHFLRRH